MKSPVKEFLTKYVPMVLGIFAGSIFILFLLQRGAIAYTDHMNEKYRAAFEAGERAISSPWYENGLHLVDEAFIDELDHIRDRDCIVSLGSSLSRISMMESSAGDRDFAFLVCGNGNLVSDELLYNLAELDGALGEGDVIKLEISHCTFKDNDNVITATILDKWGRYSLREGSSIEPVKNTDLLLPVYKINTWLIKIQNMWELLSDQVSGSYSLLRGSYNYDRVIPGNFRNNYFNYELLAEDMEISREKKEKLQELIEKLSAEHRLVVEISPLNPELEKLSQGQEFDSYLDGELLPYLEGKGIEYIDFRGEFSEEDFTDGVHLGYEAGRAYSERLGQELSR